MRAMLTTTITHIDKEKNETTKENQTTTESSLLARLQEQGWSDSTLYHLQTRTQE